jgi:hypothetical protein
MAAGDILFLAEAGESNVSSSEIVRFALKSQ